MPSIVTGSEDLSKKALGAGKLLYRSKREEKQKDKKYTADLLQMSSIWGRETALGQIQGHNKFMSLISDEMHVSQPLLATAISQILRGREEAFVKNIKALAYAYAKVVENDAREFLARSK